MQRIVMACANLPVSIPRGRGRRVVTLYEAQIRRLATGRVYRRAAVLDFIRLVDEAAALTPEPTPITPPAALGRLQDHLDRLRAAASTEEGDALERTAVTFYKLLLDTLGRRARR